MRYVVIFFPAWLGLVLATWIACNNSPLPSPQSQQCTSTGACFYVDVDAVESPDLATGCVDCGESPTCSRHCCPMWPSCAPDASTCAASGEPCRVQADCCDPSRSCDDAPAGGKTCQP